MSVEGAAAEPAGFACSAGKSSDGGLDLTPSAILGLIVEANCLKVEVVENVGLTG